MIVGLEPDASASTAATPTRTRNAGGNATHPVGFCLNKREGRRILMPLLCVTLAVPACTSTPVHPPAPETKEAPALRQSTQTPAPSISVPPAPRYVALAAPPRELKPQMAALSDYAAQGAKGAGKGVLGGAAAGAIQGCLAGASTGAFFIITCPALSVFGAVYGMTVGTVVGIRQGAPTEANAVAAKRVEAALVAMPPQRALSDAVQESVKAATGQALATSDTGPDPASGARPPDYRSLAASGISAVLETRVDRFGFDSAGGVNPDVALAVVAHARLIDTGTTRDIWARDFVYVSAYAQMSQWAAQDFALVKAEYTRAVRALGEQIAERALLQTERFDPCGLQPRGGLFVPAAALPGSDIVLQWTPLSPADPMQHERAGSDVVVYDIRIWREDPAGDPGELLEAKDGLALTTHTVKGNLAPGSNYLWSVRARYREGDRWIATRWSRSPVPSYPTDDFVMSTVRQLQNSVKPRPAAPRGSQADLPSPCSLDFVRNANYYRFAVAAAPAPSALAADGGTQASERTQADAQNVRPATLETGNTLPLAMAQPALEHHAPKVDAVVGDRFTYAASGTGKRKAKLTIEVAALSGTTLTEHITRDEFPAFSAHREVQTRFPPVLFYPALDLPGGYQLWEIAPYLPIGTQLSIGAWLGAIDGRFVGERSEGRLFVAKARISGRERVRVPAGEFDAWKIQTIWQTGVGPDPESFTCTFWYAPQIGRTVKMKSEIRWRITADLKREPENQIYELVAVERAQVNAR